MIRDVNRVGFRCVRSHCVYLFGHPFRVCFRPADARHPRAFIRKPQRDGGSYPPARSGNERNLIFKSHTTLFLI